MEKKEEVVEKTAKKKEVVKNYFEILNDINVSEKIEKKEGLSYLSWSFAWAELKKIHPDANYEIVKFENNLPYIFDEKTGYMVFTRVTINDLTHEMWLPVMDSKNKSMKNVQYEYTTKYGKKTVEAATMFDINKTIMRCLVKNLAMFGLGLYIYAGEDLPEEEKKEEEAKKTTKATVSQIAMVEEAISEDRIPGMLNYYRISRVEDLSVAQASEIIKKMKGNK